MGYGRDTITKFGRSIDLDTGDLPADIWELSRPFVFLVTPQTLFLTSTEVADDQTIFIEGLDAKGFRQTEVLALTGQTPTETAKVYLRINRVRNVSITPTTGDVYLSKNTNVTLGVPIDLDDTQAVFVSTMQQTRQAHFTLPVDRVGYLEYIFFSLLPKTAQAVSASMNIFVRTVSLRPNGAGGTWLGAGDAGVITTGTSHINRTFTKDSAVKIFGLTDIRITVTLLTSNDSDVSCGYGIVLDNNRSVT